MINARYRNGKGSIRGFHGQRVYHTEERPHGTEDFMDTSWSSLLPTHVLAKGYKLIELYPPRYTGFDPVILYDRWGHIVYQWPDNYMPTCQEVFDVCNELNL